MILRWLGIGGRQRYAAEPVRESRGGGCFSAAPTFGAKADIGRDNDTLPGAASVPPSKPPAASLPPPPEVARADDSPRELSQFSVLGNALFDTCARDLPTC